MLFKWIINLFTIAIPYSFIAQIFFFYNILFNADWNQFWAGGNVYLIANTFFAWTQTIHSTLLIAEMPLFMQYWKLGRLADLIFSIIYNIIFFALLGELLWVMLIGDH